MHTFTPKTCALHRKQPDISTYLVIQSTSTNSNESLRVYNTLQFYALLDSGVKCCKLERQLTSVDSRRSGRTAPPTNWLDRSSALRTTVHKREITHTRATHIQSRHTVRRYMYRTCNHTAAQTSRTPPPRSQHTFHAMYTSHNR